MSAAIPIIWVVYPFLELSAPAQFGIFGLSSIGSPYHWGALIIQLIILANGISAFGLLFGKNWGLPACMVSGYIGLAICIFTMVVSGFATFRLELLIQIPYLVKLHKLRIDWNKTPDAS